MLQALVTAAAAGDLDKLVAALARDGGGLIVDQAVPRSGRTALTAAANGGHRAVVVHLVDVAHASIDRPDRDSGATALGYAAFRGHLAIVEDLVARGANVDGGTAAPRWTPVWCAAVKGHLDVVVALLKHGATAHGGGEWTVLDGGAMGGHVHVVAYVWDYAHAATRGAREEEGAATVKYAAARYAAYHGHDEVVFSIADGYAETRPDVADTEAPLLSAARHGHVDVVRFLLEHDADGLAGRVCCSTALGLAARHDHVDVVRELCAAHRRPPDDDARTWRLAGPRVTAWLARTRGYSPFDLACDRGDVEAVRVFLRAPDAAAVSAAAVAAAASRTDTYCDGAAVASLLRDALAPWCPRVHAVRPASFRAMVVPVLLACRRRGIPWSVAVFHVVASCGRDWWRRPPVGGGEGGVGGGVVGGGREGGVGGGDGGVGGGDGDGGGGGGEGGVGGGGGVGGEGGGEGGIGGDVGGGGGGGKGGIIGGDVGGAVGIGGGASVDETGRGEASAGETGGEEGKNHAGASPFGGDGRWISCVVIAGYPAILG